MPTATSHVNLIHFATIFDYFFLKIFTGHKVFTELIFRSSITQVGGLLKSSSVHLSQSKGKGSKWELRAYLSCTRSLGD